MARKNKKVLFLLTVSSALWCSINYCSFGKLHGVLYWGQHEGRKATTNAANIMNEDMTSSNEDIKASVLGGEHNALPQAVVHVGPYKTASTTMEDVIWHASHALEMDNYDVPTNESLPGKHSGPKTHCNLANCLQNLDSCHHDLFPTFQRFLQYLASKRKNFIISTECLSAKEVDIKKLYELLKPWNVKIVVHYRPFHEWLPSFYFQLNRHKCINKNQSQTHAEWQNQSQTYAEWLTTHTIDEISQLCTLLVTHRYQKYFKDIEIVNIHDNNFIENFFCKVIPDATNACNYIKSNNAGLDHEHMNEKHSLIYEIMALKAFERGFIKESNFNCTNIAQAVQERTQNVLNVTLSEFPQFCASQKKILEVSMMSLETEKLIATKSLKTILNEKLLFAEIQKATSTSCCSVDITKLLEEKSWQSFFCRFSKE